MSGTTDHDQSSNVATGVAHAIAPDKVPEQAASIARTILDGHYGVGFAQDIEVRRKESMADDEHDTFLDITIVFDAKDQEECDPGWLVTFLTELRTALVEVGIEEFPVPSYLLKSERQQLEE